MDRRHHRRRPREAVRFRRRARRRRLLASRPARVLGLLGPNGAGKTTAVRDPHHDPEARRRPRRGARHRRRPRTRKRCASASASRASTPRSTRTSPATRTCAWSAGSRTSTEDDRARRADELLERFELADAADRPVRTYSRRHAAPARPRGRARAPARRCCSSTSRPPASTRRAAPICGA